MHLIVVILANSYSVRFWGFLTRGQVSKGRSVGTLIKTLVGVEKREGRLRFEMLLPRYLRCTLSFRSV